MRIAVFYHCVFEIEGKLLPSALEIVADQMASCKLSGLLNAADEFHVGMNAGDEGAIFSALFPDNAQIVYHGLQCRNECRTIRLIEEWLPGHKDWYVLYFHAKGCTHPAGDPMRLAWKECMMRHVVKNWRQCVSDLGEGHEAVGAHWMKPPATPPGQFIFAGSFWWCKASFLATLPSIMERARIKQSGIDSIESRYEAEVILGNGHRPPIVKDYCPNWCPGRAHVA